MVWFLTVPSHSELAITSYTPIPIPTRHPTYCLHLRGPAASRCRHRCAPASFPCTPGTHLTSRLHILPVCTNSLMYLNARYSHLNHSSTAAWFSVSISLSNNDLMHQLGIFIKPGFSSNQDFHQTRIFIQLRYTTWAILWLKSSMVPVIEVIRGSFSTSRYLPSPSLLRFSIFAKSAGKISTIENQTIRAASDFPAPAYKMQEHLKDPDMQPQDTQVSEGQVAMNKENIIKVIQGPLLQQ